MGRHIPSIPITLHFTNDRPLLPSQKHNNLSLSLILAFYCSHHSILSVLPPIYIDKALILSSKITIHFLLETDPIFSLETCFQSYLGNKKKKEFGRIWFLVIWYASRLATASSLPNLFSMTKNTSPEITIFQNHPWLIP